MTYQEDVNRRSKSRGLVLTSGTVAMADGSRRVLVRDLSRHGAQVYDNRSIAEGQDVCFKQGPLFVAARVAWSRKGVASLEFYRDLTEAELEEAFHPGDA